MPRAAAEPRRSVRRADRDARARAVSRQSRRALSSRRPDLGQAPLGLAAVDLLRAAASRGAITRSGATATPHCSSSTSRPRSRPVIGPASNAGAPTRKRSREKWAQAKGGAVPRAPAMDLVLQSERLDGRAKRTHERAFEDLPDGTFVALNGDARTRCAAHICCAGATAATRRRSRARAAPRPFSRRRASSLFWLPAIGRSGIRARTSRLLKKSLAGWNLDRDSLD